MEGRTDQERKGTGKVNFQFYNLQFSINSQ